MALTNVARRLTAGEIAREPRNLGVVAWFDGYARGNNPKAPATNFPRRLTTGEASDWRDGYRTAQTEASCHRAHGFGPHTTECGGA